MTEPLFEMDVPPPAPKLKPDQRRIQRQAEHLAAGQHPLVAALRTPLGLHPNAAPADDRDAPGLRCGTCEFRVVPWREVAGRFPKCSFGGKWARATGGPGTDVRAWWPACPDYSPAS